MTWIPDWGEREDIDRLCAAAQAELDHVCADIYVRRSRRTSGGWEAAGLYRTDVMGDLWLVQPDDATWRQLMEAAQAAIEYVDAEIDKT